MKNSHTSIQDLVEYSVKKALQEGFDEVLSTAIHTRESMVRISNNVITIAQSRDSITLALYLTKNQRIYFAEHMVKSREDIDRILQNVKSSIQLIEPSEFYAPLPEPSGKPLQGLYDSTVEDYLYKVPELGDMVIAVGANEGIDRIAGMIRLGIRHRVLMSSKSSSVLEEKRSFVEVYTRAFKGDVTGHWAYTSTRLNVEKVREVALKSSRLAREYSTLRTMKIEDGVYEAILSPLVVGNILSYLAMMASGLAVLLRFSIFSKYGIGSQIASEKFTIIDDPLNTELPEATGFDEEGVATKTKPLIERGIVKNILHNSKTAKKMNTESTGNAGIVMPRPWNLVIEKGDLSEEEMFSEIKRGLFVVNNWYTRFHNFEEGLFSTVSRDIVIYIEKGRPKGLVKRVRIADTIPAMLQNVDGLSKTQYDIRWWEVMYPTRAPFIYVKRLHFTYVE